MSQEWTIPPELNAEMTPAARAFVQMLCARIDELEAELVEFRRQQGTPIRFEWQPPQTTRAGRVDDVARAIQLMEAFPERSWTVSRLAEELSMSRSAFAMKFKRQTGQAPGEFLLECRMQLAVRLLGEGRQHLKEVARRVGYRSVPAFSTAFKRWCGRSPSACRKTAVEPSALLPSAR